MKQLLIALVFLTSVSVAHADIYGSSLMGWWTLDTRYISGTTVTDNSGNGRTGTATNGPVSGKPTPLGQGYDFDGTDDYIAVADTAALDLTDKACIAAWVKADSFTNLETNWIVAKNDFSGSELRNYSLAVNTTGKATFGGNAVNISSATTLSTGKWYHIAASYDRVNAKIYVNGKEDNSVADTDALSGTNGARLGIGRALRDAAGDAYGEWDGMIGDVRLYNQPCSAGDIKALYYMGLIHNFEYFL
jgi:hypothetical protein